MTLTESIASSFKKQGPERGEGEVSSRGKEVGNGPDRIEPGPLIDHDRPTSIVRYAPLLNVS